MAVHKAIIILSLFYIKYILNCIGAPCETLTSSTACDNAAPRCIWKTDGKCYCGSNAPLDVMFVMDESGSMGSSHFQDEREFVRDMIIQGLSDASNVHIMKFGSSNRWVHSFWNTQQPKDTAISRVMNTGYYGGATKMSKALQYVQWAFKSWAKDYPSQYGGYEKLVVFLTDGRPTGGYSPCPEVAKTQAIVGEENIMVVGLGSHWSKWDVACMVQPGYPNSGSPDWNRILEVNTWNQAAFDAARQAAAKFLCPEVMSLKLTEARMERYENLPTIHESRFIEIYNYGSNAIDLAVDTLKFEGFMESVSFGAATSGSSCTIALEAKQYLVLYDPSMDIPECPNCNCTLDVNDQCDEALYIPCDNQLSSNGCGECTWSVTDDNDVWSQKVMDFAGDGILSETARASRAAWPKRVYTGYSSELISVSTDPSDGGNWDMSCYYQGTPGAPPLRSCDVLCISDICQSNGDLGAFCNTQKDICQCTSSNQYILTNSQTTCIHMPPPTNCEAVNRYDNNLGGPITDIAWQACNCYENGVKYEVYISKEITSKRISYASSTQRYDPIAPLSGNTIVEVKTFIYDLASETNVYSLAATCPVTTQAPTKSPTPSPTYSNADIDWCVATIISDVQGYKIEVEWSKGYKAQELTDIDPDEFGNYEYYLFGYFIENDESSKIGDKFTTVLAETLYTNILDLPNNPPDINVATVYKNKQTGGIDYNRMKTDGVRDCIIKTIAPTPAPTDIPSTNPSKKPTNDPTHNPTMRPTYSAWILDECHLEINNIVNAITFKYRRENIDSAQRATIIFKYGNSQQEFGVNDNDDSLTLEIILPVLFNNNNNDFQYAIINSDFNASIQYSPYYQSPISISSVEIGCTFDTLAPTKSPTKSPSIDPTISPTKQPSITPTKSPSNIPTSSPTYKALTLTTCVASILNGDMDMKNVQVDFRETIFDSNDLQYPPSNQIIYVAKVGDREEGYLVASQSDTPVTINLFNVDIDVGVDVISVNIQEPYGDDSLPIQCDIVTQSPSQSPTTPSPTQYPISQQPWVRFALDESSISKWGFDGGCMFATNDNPNDITTCIMTRNTDEKHFYIERNAANFQWDIQLFLLIEYLEGSDNMKMSHNDFQIGYGRGKTNEKWFKLFKGDDVISDKYIIGGLNDYIMDIKYYLKNKNNNNVAKIKENVFIISIVDCIVDETESAYNKIPRELISQYMCTVGTEYNKILISIKELDEDDTFITQKEGEMPMWVWYPIIAAGIAIPFVAYLIWRFYNAKKRADVMEDQRKFELGEAEKQDDIGEFGVIGDTIQSNPIATGNAFEVGKGDDIIAHQLKIEKMNFEPAKVEVEHNIFKQDFGPVQVEKNNLDSPNNVNNV